MQRVLFYYPFANTPLSEKKISELMEGSLFVYAGEQTSPVYGKLVQFSHSYTQGKFTTQVTFSFAMEKNCTLVSAETNDTKNQMQYRVIKLEKLEEHYVPKAFSKVWNALGNEETIPIQKDEYTVNEFSFKDVPNELFAAVLQAGDNVLELPSNARLTQGANGERLYQNKNEPQSTRQYAWVYMASITSLLFLTLLAYIRWKRKQGTMQ